MLRLFRDGVGFSLVVLLAVGLLGCGQAGNDATRAKQAASHDHDGHDHDGHDHSGHDHAQTQPEDFPAGVAAVRQHYEAIRDAFQANDADNCPFCRAKKAKLLASTALVQVVDAEGNVPAMDARKLLGLKEGRTIVVRGEAQIDGLGNLAVRAAGIYVRPDALGTAS